MSEPESTLDILTVLRSGISLLDLEQKPNTTVAQKNEDTPRHKTSFSLITNNGRAVPIHTVASLQTFFEDEFPLMLANANDSYGMCSVFDLDDTLHYGSSIVSFLFGFVQNGSFHYGDLPALNGIAEYLGLGSFTSVNEAMMAISDSIVNKEKLQNIYNFRTVHCEANCQPEEIWEGIWNAVIIANNYAFSGTPIPEFEAYSIAFFSGFKGNQFDGMKELVDVLRNAGTSVYIVSAGLEPFAVEGAKPFGLDESHVEGINLGIKDGIITSEITGTIMTSKGKAKTAFELCGGKKPLVVFGDSDVDIQMCNSAYLCIIVEPQEKIVNKIETGEIHSDGMLFMLNIDKTESNTPVLRFDEIIK